jgi:hypothetical protein
LTLYDKEKILQKIQENWLIAKDKLFLPVLHLSCGLAGARSNWDQNPSFLLIQVAANRVQQAGFPNSV